MINFRTLTLDDIIALLNATGLITTKAEFKYAADNDLFKYVGCKNNSAQYIIAVEDDDNDGSFYVSRIHVTIGHDKLQADYSGTPEYYTNSEEWLAEYFVKTCV